MPFTPFHLGPPFLIIGIVFLVKGPKILQAKYLTWLGGLLVGSVIPDVQGFYAIFFDEAVSLHGFSHTLIGSLIYSIFGVVIVQILTKLIFQCKIDWYQGYLAVIVGILFFHFLPDMLIWSDMNIFWPFSKFSYGHESRYETVALILGLQFIAGFIITLIGFIRSR